MAVNKITYDGNVLIDLTQDTASAADVRSGKTFHASDGTTQTGTFTGGTDYTEQFIAREYPLASPVTYFSTSKIGAGAFGGYSASDKSLYFSNCTTIERNAFLEANFSELTFPMCATINTRAFASITVNNLAFPSCTIIETGAFVDAEINGVATFPQVVTINALAFESVHGNGTLSFTVCSNIVSTARPFSGTTLSLYFPAMTTIPLGAFEGYYGSQLIKSMFPNATIAGSSAFRSAKGITRIDWDGLVSAYQYAFGNCTSLVSVNLPSLKGTAGVNLFYGDQVLANVSLPELNACAAGTFYQCYGLTSIYLPKVSYISNTTFAYCSYLTAAYFTSLNKISSTYAFRNCLRLISLYLLGSSMVTLTSRVAFTSTPLSNYSTTAGQWGSIYVRASLLSTYLANTNWASFADRLVGLTDAQIAALPIYS